MFKKPVFQNNNLVESNECFFFFYHSLDDFQQYSSRQDEI